MGRSSVNFFDFRKREKRSMAAALVYDPVGSEPPQVLATGSGLLADEIVRVAKEHGVPLYEDAALVEALARLDCSTSIPRELYAVVAEVLAFVYRLDEQTARSAS
jgi:flagellar biosynthesis protein